MIYGCKRWKDESIHYDQTNNIIEGFLLKEKTLGDSTFWLESCNVESTSCLVEAVGAEWTVERPRINGKVFMGYSDVMFDFLNSPNAAAYLPTNNKTLPNNELKANLAYAVRCMSTAKAQVLSFDNGSDLVDGMVKALMQGHGVGVSYKTDYGGGHYVAVVGYDDETDEVIVYDSWPNNKHCKNKGKKERYGIDFFESRGRLQCIEVWL